MREYGVAIGYYVTCDDAVCARCAPAGFASGDYSAWPGFESWESPIAIFIDSESDTPTHCHECESLIPHDLTTDGHEYVREALENALKDPGQANWPVQAAWFEEYGRNMDESDLRDVISDLVEHYGQH